MTKSILFSMSIYFLLASCSKPKESPESLVLGKIKKASKLSTVEFIVQKTLFNEQKNFWAKTFPSLFSDVMVASTEATIKVGIDLNKLDPKKIKYAKDVLSVQLPPVEVTNFSYPAEKFKLNTDFTRSGAANKLSVEEVDEILRDSQLKIMENIHALGIYEVAEERTRQMVTNMLLNVGFPVVYVTFDTVNYQNQYYNAYIND